MVVSTKKKISRSKKSLNDKTRKIKGGAKNNELTKKIHAAANQVKIIRSIIAMPSANPKPNSLKGFGQQVLEKSINLHGKLLQKEYANLSTGVNRQVSLEGLEQRLAKQKKPSPVNLGFSKLLGLGPSNAQNFSQRSLKQHIKGPRKPGKTYTTGPGKLVKH